MAQKMDQMSRQDVADPLVGERPQWWWALRLEKAQGLKAPNLATCSRQEALDYFANGWGLSDLLFSSLQGEQAFARAPDHGLRHPMIFYYGHTATLFVNKMRVAGLLESPVNEEFERLFEVGVDEMSWDDMDKNHRPWPKAQAVAAYRREVFDLVSRVLMEHPDLEPGHAPIGPKSQLWALFMGMEHERIHLETSSVLLREMPLDLLRLPSGWPSARLSPRGEARLLGFSPLGPADVELGKPVDFPSYGWDNEYGSRVVSVGGFEISRAQATNQELLEFVKDGGYAKERYWSSEGWRWRSFVNAKHPKFWVPQGPEGLRSYAIRTIFEEVEWAPDWPACVNFHEAKAYLAWRSERDGRAYRLPTEAEHALARRGAARPAPEADVSLTQGGARLRESRLANVALAWGSECSVSWARPQASEAIDLGGNVWDWCEDDFNPLEGFEAHSYYEDFSSPCFDGRHAMILGGSFISCGDEASPFARFHFRRHFHQHAGFRAVAARGPSGAAKIKEKSSKYDQRSVLDQYLLFHFGPDDLALPAGMKDAGRFPQKMANLAARVARVHGAGLSRAIDVGCAVGGSSFELARHFGEVVGVDLSDPFVDAARALSRGESIAYRVATEGDLGVWREASVESGARPAFRQGDACALDASLEGFDAVLASNLLCRLPRPRAFLARLGQGLLRAGGVVVFASPLSWQEAFTPKEHWLGGTVGPEGERLSFDGLREALGDRFELVERQDMPFMIREHARKFEYVVSDVTAWRFKG